MTVQNLEYVKVSNLPVATSVGDNDVLIVNHNGKTSKIDFKTLMTIIDSKVTHDVATIQQDINTLKQTVQTLATTVNEQSQTINNIITAGFNLIGVDK